MAKFVTFENLTSEAIEQLNLYIDLTESYGVVVGAIVGDLSWDIKPLIIINGSLKLIRAHDPSLPNSKKHLQAFLKHLSKLQEFGFLYKSKEAKVFLIRDFLQTTLVDLLESKLLEDLGKRKKIIHELITLVQDNFSAGLVHGHICAENLAIDDGAPLLLDYCSQAFSPSVYQTANTLAPEIKKGSIPTESSDIYGLSLIIKKLLLNDLSEVQSKMLAAMSSDNLFTRPDIAEVLDVFKYIGNEQLKFAKKEITPTPEVKTEIEIPVRRRQPTVKVVFNEQMSVEEKLQWLEGTTALSRDMINKIKDSISDATQESLEVDLLKTNHKITDPKNNLQSDLSAKQIIKPAKSIEIKPNILKVKEVPEVKDQRQLNRILQLILLVILCFVLTAIAMFFTLTKKEETHPPVVEIKPIVPVISVNSELKDLWNTGLSSRMMEVAKKAIAGDQQAELLIIKDILAGAKPVNVDVEFLKLVYDSRWEQFLTLDDRKLAMAFALSALIGEKPKLTKDQKVNPAILYALLIHKPEEIKSNFFKTKTDVLFKLPDPIGVSFQKLASVVDSDLPDPEVSALASFWQGNFSPTKFLDYFSPANDLKSLLGLIRIFRDTPAFTPANTKLVLTALPNHKGLVEVTEWFMKNQAVKWEQVESEFKFDLLSGVFPKADFTYQQLVDLLKFPIPSIVEASRSKLAQEHPELNQAILDVILQEINKLSRTQIVSLLYAFQLTGDQQLALITSWFEAKPDPEFVLALIIARQSRVSIDPFSLEAARYLKDRKWEASNEQYEKLVQNSEELVRALVYSKLDANKAFDRDLLMRMSEREPSRTLRERIQLKLNTDQ